MEVNNLRTNRRAQIGNITIPLLKGEQGDQGYSISRIARTDGDGTPGTTDTYTIYIDTTPETAIGTFQITNGTGADMFKEVYDTNDDGIVDKATADKEGNDIVQTYATKSALNEMSTSFGNEIANNTLRIGTLENAGYITRSVADLANYYLKSETYTKQEVIALCDEIPKFAIEVVSVLPTQDISETTIYLLRDDEETQDVYQEYIYVNNTWERIGGQRIDLSNYYQKSETYSKDELNGKLVVAGAEPPKNGERVWFAKSSNLLPYSDLSSYTENGITVTNNNDGTFTVNGTATANLSTAINTVFIPMNGTWKLIGCPSGGSSSTYMLSAYVGYWGESSPNIDTGSGTTITYTGNVKIRLYIKSGTTCNNLIFKPMITYDTSKSYESFEPYAKQGIYIDGELWISKE